MFRKIILLFLILPVSLALKAQSDTSHHSLKYKKFSIGLNIGAGIPINEYASTSINRLPASMLVSPTKSDYDTNKLNGFAKSGVHIDGYVTYIISHHIGLMALAGVSINNFDAIKYNVLYGSNYYSGYGIRINGGYYVGQYLVGPYLNLPINKNNNLSLEFKALAGIITANYPDLIISVELGNYLPAYKDISYQNSIEFGYNFGGGIKYIVTGGRLGLHLNVNYLGSNIKYPSYNSTFIEGGNAMYSYTYNIPKTMTLGIIQVNAGVSLEL